MAKRSDKPSPLLTVIYDGARRPRRTRMAIYKLEARRAALDIQWRDLEDEPGALDDLGLDSAARRSSLYAVDGDGAIFTGAAALALLWSVLPSHRRLGHLLATPAASAVAEACSRIARLVEPRLAEARRAAPGRG